MKYLRTIVWCLSQCIYEYIYIYPSDNLTHNAHTWYIHNSSKKWQNICVPEFVHGKAFASASPVQRRNVVRSHTRATHIPGRPLFDCIESTIWFCSWNNFAAMCRRVSLFSVVHTPLSCGTKSKLPLHHVWIVFYIDVTAFLTASIAIPQWKLICIILNNSMLVCIIVIHSHAVFVFFRFTFISYNSFSCRRDAVVELLQEMQ